LSTALRALAVALLGMCASLGSAARADGIVMAVDGDSVQVITNADRGQLKLDRATLLAIFLMRVRQWPDGAPVHVFVMPSDSSLHDRFARELLGTYPYVLSRTWDRMVFTGTGLAPEVVRSEQEMRDKVSTTPGAIGYRPAAPTSESGVVRVTVVRPGDN
jgi:ABC-type phosphate transport system substrate-binding protein